MLFGYPIIATEDNWLHDCLSQVIQSIHSNVENGNSSTDWSSILSEPYQSILKRRLQLTVSRKPAPKRTTSSLGDKLKDYQTSLESLSQADRDKILKAFTDQNKIDMLVSGNCTCDVITDFPPDISKPIKSLFDSAFKLLTDLEIRDKQYQIIYDACAPHICPFCGLEPFDAPTATREALDHYIPKYKYPFAAANLRNLVPMGYKCNSGYKKEQDLLFKENGIRRKSFDPYNHGTVSISLEKSQPFEGLKGALGEPLPKWVVEFDTDGEEVDTWNEVFHIRERYERDVLNEGFKSYLGEFGNYCRSWSVSPGSHEELIEAISRYIFFQESNGFKDKAFIKAAVFRMLRLHCQNDNQRLIQLILDNINGVQM